MVPSIPVQKQNKNLHILLKKRKKGNGEDVTWLVQGQLCVGILWIWYMPNCWLFLLWSVFNSPLESLPPWGNSIAPSLPWVTQPLNWLLFTSPTLLLLLRAVYPVHICFGDITSLVARSLGLGLFRMIHTHWPSLVFIVAHGKHFFALNSGHDNGSLL